MPKKASDLSYTAAPCAPTGWPRGRSQHVYTPPRNLSPSRPLTIRRACALRGDLTDDDFDVVAGRRDQLAGKILERYGMAKDEAERQVKDWEITADETWFERSKSF